MKRIGIISILLGLGIITVNSQDSIVSIPDTAFLYALIDEGVDMNGDSLISYEEAGQVTGLITRGLAIKDMTGIEAFVKLEDLECSANELTSLDLSNNLELMYLSVGNNQLNSLDVSSNTKLWSLICSFNQLTSLDVSKNTNLCGTDWHCFGCQKSTSVWWYDRIGLDCSNNLLTSLDVSSNTKLGALDCSFNQLTSLDVSDCDSLAYLVCQGNQLTDLDIFNNKGLEFLDCSGMQLTDLDVTNNTELTVLSCNDNQLSSLDVTNNAKLSCDLRGPGLDCSNNLLTSLDVSNNIELGILVCSGNQLTSLDISNNIHLSNLELSDMPSLGQVCVWESFPVYFVDTNLREWDASINSTNSPNVFFTTECSAGIEKRYYNNIAIYPNPTNTILTIETGISDLYNIEITSQNGQLILSKEMEGTTHQLDLSSFQSGVYFITIRSKDFTTTRKIIKM